jgi:leucine-zipper-like transcriptional regulator 1
MFDIKTQRWTCIQESSDDSQRPDESDAAVGDIAINNNNNPVNNCNWIQQPLSARVRGKIPCRRFGYVSVVHHGKFILFGGFDGQRWLHDMFVFDLATRIWTEIEPRGAIPSVRSCPAWAKDATHVYIHGGYDGHERKADFFACDLTTYTWTEMPCLGNPPSPRYFHSCCLYGNKMYCYGGCKWILWLQSGSGGI